MTEGARPLSCFKAYDIRGVVPDELDEQLAAAIGRAYVERFRARRVVLGRDMRLSSDAIAAALIDGITGAGADVVDIGLAGTEQVYFATFHLEREGVDGGIAVTASHNPKNHNGMKLVTKGAVPVSGDSGLFDIRDRAAFLVTDMATTAFPRGKVEARDLLEPYLEHLLSYVDVATLKPLKIVANGGNGCAGPVVRALTERLPFEVVHLLDTPDGNFPHGVPNPLLPENRTGTIEAVRAHGADLGLAWDGDFDRCFFFDEQGGFVEGYYMVGLLAAELLRGQPPGTAVIHDPRLCWATQEVVASSGGRAVMSKTGHAFIKERMRAEDAIYGGEMSAHHYFRRFAFCDSGMIPWLLVAQLMSRTGKSLAALVGDMQRRFPASGEINLHLPDVQAALAAVEARFGPQAQAVDRTDGLSLDLGTWRLNVRASNTEPVLRLNVESRGDWALMEEKTRAVLAVLRGEG
jgi:phosphomannomutase